MIERLGEAIRKYQILVEMQPDTDVKKVMMSELALLKAQYADIVQRNLTCPPDLVPSISHALDLIDELYNKKACN